METLYMHWYMLCRKYDKILEKVQLKLQKRSILWCPIYMYFQFFFLLHNNSISIQTLSILISSYKMIFKSLSNLLGIFVKRLQFHTILPLTMRIQNKWLTSKNFNDAVIILINGLIKIKMYSHISKKTLQYTAGRSLNPINLWWIDISLFYRRLGHRVQRITSHNLQRYSKTIHLDFYEAIIKDYHCIIEIFWRRSFVLYVH